MSPVFLSAKWLNLVLVNYSVDPALLEPHLPFGTTLDLFRGKTYVSLVGFQFLDTKVLGFSIPFHKHFPEINLRFYVQRITAAGEKRRGVVFLRELVPRFLIAATANILYKENYLALPMTMDVQDNGDERKIEYKTKVKNNWHSVYAQVAGKPEPILEGSQEEYIAEHYWGYAKRNEKSTTEYRVEHPKWNCYSMKTFHTDMPFAALYGQDFGHLTNIEPSSIFIANGSEITVNKPNVIV